MLKASCFCCTYGRPHLLEEALESFLRQDYSGPKELVILNDYDGHTLLFDHPEVIIVNSPKRILPLGHKFNVAANMCSGDVLLPWEDDDIYLPWRISYALDNLQEGLFHTQQAWLDEGNGDLSYSENLYQCNLAVSREIWSSVGGYAEEDVSAIDVDLFRRIGGPDLTQIIPEEKLFYVYRWSTTHSYHGSAMGGLTSGVSDSAAKFVAERAARKEMPLGQVYLQPAWRGDWVSAAGRAIERGQCRDNYARDESQQKIRLENYFPWHPGFVFGESLVVPDLSRTQLHLFNPLARALWQGMFAEFSEEKIKAAITSRLPIDESSLGQDIDILLRQWLTTGLIRRRKPALSFKSHASFAVEVPDARFQQQVSQALSHLASEPTLGWDHLMEIREEDQFYSVYRDEAQVASGLYQDAATRALIEHIVQTDGDENPVLMTLHTSGLVKNDAVLLLGSDATVDAAPVSAALLKIGFDLLAGNHVQVHALPTLKSGSQLIKLDRSAWRSLADRYPQLEKTTAVLENGRLIKYLSSGFKLANPSVTPARICLVVLSESAQQEMEEVPMNERLPLLIGGFAHLEGRIKDQRLQCILDWVGNVEIYRLAPGSLESVTNRLNQLMV